MSLFGNLFGKSETKAKGDLQPKVFDAAQIGTLTDDELRKLDFAVVIDHSGSMGTGSTRVAGVNRLEEVRYDTQRIADFMANFDDDGLTVIPFSAEAKMYDGVGSLKVAQVFKQFQPDYSTNLGAAIRLANQKAESSNKNMVVAVFTDGSPDSQAEVVREIEAAGRRLGRPKIGYVFIQVGNDPGATAFLKHLDTNMKVDVVATLKAEQASTITVGQLAWLAQNQ